MGLLLVTMGPNLRLKGIILHILGKHGIENADPHREDFECERWRYE